MGMQNDKSRGAVWASLTAAVLAAAAAIVGLAAGTSIYGEVGPKAALIPNDFVTLVLAIPFLLTSVWLRRLRRPFSMYGWLASLFYLLYTYVPYAIDVPTRGMLGVYIPLVAALLLAIGLLISSGAVARIPLVSARRVGVGIFLLGLSVFVLVYQSVDVIGWITGGQPELRSSVGLLVADLSLGVPLLAITGIQSITGRGLGPVGGASMLLAFAVLSVGLLLLFVVQIVAESAVFSFIDFAVVILLVLACLVVFGVVIRPRGADEPAGNTDPH